MAGANEMRAQLAERLPASIPRHFASPPAVREVPVSFTSSPASVTRCLLGRRRSSCLLTELQELFIDPEYKGAS